MNVIVCTINWAGAFRPISNPP